MFSLPLMILLILLRWLQKISTTNPKLMMLNAVSWKNRDAINIRTTDIKLVIDTVLVRKSNGMKITAQIKKNWRLYPRINPAEVATAFPPLNFKKIEKACPKMAASPKIIHTQCGASSLKIIGRLVAKVPLKKSTKKTKIPAFFPSTLNVFVVPIFPEP